MDLIGHLGADPEVRYTANGSAVTAIRVCTSESWKDKQTGQQVEKSEWHRVKAFGKLAEIMGEHLKKGRQVWIEGRLSYDRYTDREGVERFSVEIIASSMVMLGGGGSRDGETPPAEDSPPSAPNDGKPGSRKGPRRQRPGESQD